MSESTEKINVFLKELNFKKKKVGGADIQEVLTKFSALDALYQTALMENMQMSEKRISELREELNKKNEEIKELSLAVDEIKGLSGVTASQELLIKENESLKAQLRSVMAEKEGNTEKEQASSEPPCTPQKDVDITFSNEKEIEAAVLSLKTQMLSETAAEKEQILAAARKEAEELVTAAKLEKEQIKIKSFLEVEYLKKEKQALTEELGRVLAPIKAIVDGVSAQHVQNNTENISD